ncbi:MAG: ABC transporter permease [Nitrospirae bacterium]|nr:ABC transporter permease [Nitrospirota bacterium]
MKAAEINRQMEALQEEEWTKVISPKKGWFDLNLLNLWNYRDLIMLFVKRDFTAFYKQTILGPIWFLLQPLFTTIVFTVIFGRIAKISTDGLPQMLFYMSGIVVWNYFADCLNKTSDTFVSNAGIFGKVYFPRLTVPVSIVITNLITFSIQFSLFLVFWTYYYLNGAVVKASLWSLLTPLLLIQMAALGLGLGILISSLTTKYRDLRYVIGFGVQLWMYATPIVYPMSQIPEKWHWIYVMNPMASIVETARYAFLGAGAIRPMHMVISLGMTTMVLIVGILMFSRIEKTFMDTV